MAACTWLADVSASGSTSGGTLQFIAVSAVATLALAWLLRPLWPYRRRRASGAGCPGCPSAPGRQVRRRSG